MKNFLLPAIVLLMSFTYNYVQGQRVSFEEVYTALADESGDKIQPLLDKIGEAPQPPQAAYRGVLLMKNAGEKFLPTDKLSTFRKGKAILENEIKKDPGNTVYRFLRLMIQDNAPAILGYNDEIEEDKAKIIRDFSSLPKGVQEAILSYCGVSGMVRVEDFE